MINKHIALARKYRPKNFLELKGQNVLVTTLTNAINSNRIAQSYLLTGIRGIGKTTTARIIAKTVNCTSPRTIDSIVTPCEECPNCVSILNGSHPDILEIDAASRTGVDDVRIIIENAEYKPMMGVYKIFIIDEVHMLSKNAFNALLKLLEEPPAHCIFIFATTEVHKIPLTILSRCQRFDLARFSKEELGMLLKDIADKENLSITDDAIKILALKGDGSARDSLSLLDQSIILARNDEGGLVSHELVSKMISAVDRKFIIEFLAAIIRQDAKASIAQLGEFYATNTDFNIFIQEFLALLSYIAKKITIESYVEDEFCGIEEEVMDLISKVDITFIQIAWQIAFKTEAELKQSLNGLQTIEMLALKLIYLLSKKDDVQTPPPPTQRSENNIVKGKESREDLSFNSFLQFLSGERDFHILFELFHKSEFIELAHDVLTIARSKQDMKFEAELKQKLAAWSSASITCKIMNKDSIKPYKESVADELMLEPLFDKFLKNFPEVEILDILVSANSNN